MNDTGTTIDIDSVLAAPAAIELARAAVLDLAEGSVGDYIGAHTEPATDGDIALVVTHSFASSVPGYVGWNWAATIARLPDSDQVTVDEVVLLPGPGALLAPVWVPWSERMRAGDLSPGDLVAPRPDDPRLVPAYADLDLTETGDYAGWDDWRVDQVADELGLGRVHVLSLEGRLDAADRWLAGPGGPQTEMAKLAPAQCGTCGFLLRLAGSLHGAFGVCGNELALSDGQVVSVEAGCGAHSEAMAELILEAEPGDPGGPTGPLPMNLDDQSDLEPIE